jgi:hypothetical protein
MVFIFVSNCPIFIQIVKFYKNVMNQLFGFINVGNLGITLKHEFFALYILSYPIDWAFPNLISSKQTTQPE